MPANPLASAGTALDDDLGMHSIGWWIGYVGCYCLSAAAASAVIIRVIQGRRAQKDTVVRVSIENLMAQMVRHTCRQTHDILHIHTHKGLTFLKSTPSQQVLMIAVCDLLYDVLWLYWNLSYVLDPGRLSKGFQRFIYCLTQLLMFSAHIMLAAHLHAWTVRRSSPAKLSQRFPRRIAILTFIIFTIAAVLGFAIDPAQNNAASTHCDAAHIAVKQKHD